MVDILTESTGIIVCKKIVRCKNIFKTNKLESEGIVVDILTESTGIIVCKKIVRCKNIFKTNKRISSD